MGDPEPKRLIPTASRRRDKPQLSCTLCRRRKLRCDRNQPCETCSQRGLSLSCTYVHYKTPERVNGTQVPHGSVSNLSNRIEQLEQLVVSLMNAAKGTTSMEHISHQHEQSARLKLVPDIESETDNESQIPASQLVDHFGDISLESSQAPRWNAVLDGIAELKDYCQEDDTQDERHVLSGTYSESNRQEILFGNYPYLDKQDILAAIPPRSLVDRLVAEYCKNSTVAPIILHLPTFLKEYEQFWEQPMNTPIIWIGLLFSIMALSTIYQSHIIHSFPDRKSIVQSYKEQIPKCLSMGNYTTDPYTIETLIIYLYIEYIDTEDSQTETWILYGVIVNLALRKSYNRDALHFPNISPFQGEMRRRLWALLIHYDALASAQVGVPRSIRDSHYDTAEPLNLLDEDFGEDIVLLPPARPEIVHTPVQYVVASNRVAIVFGQISDAITSIRPPLYTEIMRLDKVLQEAYASVPEGLQVRPMAQSLMDPPVLIINRIYISLLYQKASCVLHYKYIILSRTDSRYAYSRTACVEAALQILDTQWTLHNERKPGGRLYQAKVQSLIKSSFYLATTLLCLNLDYDLKAEANMTTPGSDVDPELRSRTVQALYNSYLVWQQTSNESRESRKVTDVLRVMLRKAEQSRVERPVGANPMVDGSPAGSSESSNPFLTDSSSGNSSIPISPQDLNLEPTSIHTLMAFNADIDYSDIIMTPLDPDQNLNEMLQISLNSQGLFDFSL